MTTEVETGVLPAHLLDYNKRALKLVGIGKNGLPCMKWSSIYDNPNFWTDEELVQHVSDFRYGVATVFGLTRLSDEQGPVYVNNLDIDSDAVYDKLFILPNPGPKHSLIKKLFEEGFVVKTRKPKGHQIYWLSHKQNKPIHSLDCKPGYEFEIHTDKSSGTGMLPPSRHRKDPNFEYRLAVGGEIPTSDDAYDAILEILRDCLLQKSKSRSETCLPTTISEKEEVKKQGGAEEAPGDKKEYSNGEDTGIKLTDEHIERITDSIQPYYKKGRRNVIVLSLSGVFRKFGISKDSTIALIDALARHDGISEETDIRKAISVVEDTFNKDTRAVSGIRFLTESLFSVTGDRQLANEILSIIFAVIREATDGGKSPIEKEDIIQWLRRNVIAEYTCKTTTDNEELFLYDEKKGVYSTGQEWRIKAFCQSICHTAKTGVLYEVINQIKHRTYDDRSRFDSDIDILNLKNGLLNIHTLEFTEHSKDHLSIVQLPLWYDVEAKCPNILRFLGQVLKPKDVFTALQFFGYCLYRTAKYEHAILCVGKGANGKGTFLKLLEHFLGKRNISHVSLQDIGEDKFATAEFYGKFANICADLGKKKVKDTGKFKMLVSGDRMSAQHKNQHRFEFDPFAKAIFSANEIPESEDKTYAYFRRWIVFFFENVFEDDADRNMINKLTTQDELSGLLNLSLIALRQLIKDNGFAYIDDIKTITKAYTSNADSITKFVEDKCIITESENDYKICRDFYGTYLEFCEQNKLHCKSFNIFGMELSDKIAKRRRRVKGERENCYIGIKLKDEV